MVHIGKEIRKTLKAKGMPVQEFATKINKSRTVVYDIFNRETIDTGLLLSIGETLNHDFFVYYSDQDLTIAAEPNVSYGLATEKKLQQELNELRKELNSLKEKYDLLAKLNKLLEEKEKQKSRKKKK